MKQFWSVQRATGVVYHYPTAVKAQAAAQKVANETQKAVYIRGFYDTVPPRPSRVILVSPNAGRSNPPRAAMNGTKLYSDTAYGSHYRRVGPSGWEIEPSRRSPDFKGTLKWEKVAKSDIATIERMIASGRLILKSNPIDSAGRSGRSNPSHAPAYAGSLHKTNPSTKAKANALINLLGKLGYAAEIAYTSKATRGESYGYGLSRGAGTAAYYKVTSDASKNLQYVAEIVLDGTKKELEFVQVQYPNEYLNVTSVRGRKNPSSLAARSNPSRAAANPTDSALAGAKLLGVTRNRAGKVTAVTLQLRPTRVRNVR